MCADFFSVALVLSDAEAAELLGQLRGRDVEYNGNVYCEALDAVMPLITTDTPLAISPNFPAFVALDRFCAQPNGLRLLDNGAHRWLPPDELDALGHTLDRLGEAGQAEAVAMVERGGNGAQDIAAGLEALQHGLADARTTGRGLLLVCTPC